MTASRKNYQRRVDFIKKLTIVRNICFAMSFICGIPLVCEYTGENFGLFFGIGISLLLFFLSIVVGIEYFIINVAIFNGDIEFQPIFDWYIRDDAISYAEFLKKNKLNDSDENFRKYRKEISCISNS